MLPLKISPKRFKSKRYGTAVRNFGEHEFVRNSLKDGPRKSRPYTSIQCQEIEWNRTGTGTRYSLLLLCKSLPVPDSSQQTRMNPAGGNRKHKTKMMQESSDSSADANATITITVKHLNPLVKVFAPSGSSDSCIQDVPLSILTFKPRAYRSVWGVL